MQLGWQGEGLQKREAGTGGTAVAATLWVQQPDWAEEPKPEEWGRSAGRRGAALQVS